MTPNLPRNLIPAAETPWLLIHDPGGCWGDCPCFNKFELKAMLGYSDTTPARYDRQRPYGLSIGARLQHITTGEILEARIINGKFVLAKVET